jgi:CRP-like cAMP-binding protein
VTAVETALERELAGAIMRGGDKPKIRKLGAGELLTQQGQPGNEVFLVLDGVLAVDVDGQPIAEFGPGAILGERAVLEGGTRTSTNRAVTKCRVAVVPGDHLDRSVLQEISAGHRREHDDQ